MEHGCSPDRGMGKKSMSFLSTNFLPPDVRWSMQRDTMYLRDSLIYISMVAEDMILWMGLLMLSWVAKTHAMQYTTSMVPTTLTARNRWTNEIHYLLIKPTTSNRDGAQFLGGTYQDSRPAMNQKGAQDPRYVQEPLEQNIRGIVEHSGDIIRWSAAPEMGCFRNLAIYL